MQVLVSWCLGASCGLKGGWRYDGLCDTQCCGSMCDRACAMCRRGKNNAVCGVPTADMRSSGNVGGLCGFFAAAVLAALLMRGRVLYGMSKDSAVGRHLPAASSCIVPLFYACALLQMCCSISLLPALRLLSSVHQHQGRASTPAGGPLAYQTVCLIDFLWKEGLRVGSSLPTQPFIGFVDFGALW